jgi:hypothetical protein
MLHELLKTELTARELKSRLKIQKDAVPVSVRALTLRLQRRLRKFHMSLDGGVRDGKVCVVWEEKGQWIRGDAEFEALARDSDVLKPWEVLKS